MNTHPGDQTDRPTTSRRRTSAPSVPPRAVVPVVLLVEDFADTRELYVYYLSSQGYRVEEAVNGYEGQRQALRLMPDVILMDLSLPGIDGWRLTRLLKEDARTRDVPVIAVSAHSGRVDREQAMDAGCVGYLVKPCPPRMVAQEIARVLSRPHEAAERTRVTAVGG